MKRDPYTIRIFVEDGDPEGVRLIDQMNWTGQGIAFPRDKWAEIRTRKYFDYPGVYILVGYGPNDDDLPRIYVGEGDGVRSRIDSHAKGKDFWHSAMVFVSTNMGLNKAHVQWLEYALLQQAKEVGACHLDNGNEPVEPALTPSDRADTKRFLAEILQILPLAGLRAFEKPKATIPVGEKGEGAGLQLSTALDTVIVPAQKEGFEKVFLGEHRWRAVRISGGMLPKIKWIAAYQTQPVSAITHIAKVAHIEPYGDSGKYQLVFDGKAEPIKAIPFGDAPTGSMQGLRYTTKEKLLKASKLSDLF